MQELWLYLENGLLNQAQTAWFTERPAEELYDIERDPHELNNLAADPEHAEVLSRLRSALDDWLERTGDRSEQPESVMAREFWPGGEQPVTPAPAIIEVEERSVRLEPAVEGAAIGYRFDDGPWLAYPPATRLVVPVGATLSVKSVRYGWAESPEVSRSF